MDYQEIRYETVEPAIARLTMDRPDSMNAYSLGMCREMVDAIGRYMGDDSLRVLILTGAGRGFCSGGDIRGGDPEHQSVVAGQLGHAREMRETMHAVNLALRRLDKPVIAMINGPAVAGGLTLALNCDFRIASEDAKLGDPSGRVGLLPDEGGAWLFPRVMGMDRALKMSLLNEIYDAHEAERLGLVTEVVPPDQLEKRTMELARALAKRAPIAVRLAKHLMQRAQETTFEQSLADAALAVMISNDSEDAHEGITAFIEKRPPEFGGR